MKWVSQNHCAIYFSEKSDGDMLFKSAFPETDDGVKENRRLFFEKHEIPPERLVNLAGVHGVKIHIVKEKDLGRGALDPKTRIGGADGLMTNLPDSFLMVTGADCFPIFFYETRKNVIGALHGGWRSIAYGIVANALQVLRRDFGGEPQETTWWIGPGIKSCHFEVQKDVAKIFESGYPAAAIYDGVYRVDLPGIIKTQIQSSGVPGEKIVFHPDCTYCKKERWFSRRRDRPPYVEACAFIIGIE